MIPLTRFPGFVWLIIAGFKLANTRMQVSASDPPHASPESPIIRGIRLLLSLGLWLLASAIIGTASLFAAESPRSHRRHTDYRGRSLRAAHYHAGVRLSLAPGAGAGALSHFRRWPCSRRVSNVFVTAALQSAGGLWPWSSAVAILKAMGSDDGRLATAGPAVAAIITLRATLLAAVGEEMLFRGVLYTWLRQRFPAAAAIPVSAAAPCGRSMAFPPFSLAFVMGLGFGWVRERSGSIAPTIVVHALHNVALIGWAYYVSEWTARFPASG